MVAHELVFFVCGRGGIARSVLSRKGSCIPGRLFAGLHASPPGKHLMDSDLVPCQRVLAPVASAGPATGSMGPLHTSLPAGADVGEVPVTT
jgi:hypothetical protein